MQRISASRQPIAEQHARVRLREDGSVRIAVVADTHSAPHPDAARLLAAHAPDAIIHAGDIGARTVLDTLRDIAPLLAVRGNIDEHADDTPDVLEIDLCAPGDDESVLKILVVHIGVNGPKLRADTERLARARGANVVVCGHSHVPFIGRDRGFSVFNPGSIGPRRFHLPIVFGMFAIENHRASMHHVDCETGERWTPAGAVRTSQ